MTKIDSYIPKWLLLRIKLSVVNAVEHNAYAWEFSYWENHWPLGLLFFQYYYDREVILDYIETHGDWGEEQIKQGRIFKSKEVNA